MKKVLLSILFCISLVSLSCDGTDPFSPKCIPSNSIYSSVSAIAEKARINNDKEADDLKELKLSMLSQICQVNPNFYDCKILSSTDM